MPGSVSGQSSHGERMGYGSAAAAGGAVAAGAAGPGSTSGAKGSGSTARPAVATSGAAVGGASAPGSVTGPRSISPPSTTSTPMSAGGGGECKLADADLKGAVVGAALRAARSEAFFLLLRMENEDVRDAALEEILSRLRVSSLNDQAIISEHLLTVVRLSFEAPAPTVRRAFQQFLEFLRKETSTVVPPSANPVVSSFIPEEELVPMTTEDEEITGMFQSLFLSYGRVSHYHRVMAWHPTYLRAFMDTESCLLRDEAPLPRTWRHFIAVMAASRHRCLPVVVQQMTAFLAADGDCRWLGSLDAVPAKLACLAQLNALMAHRPWLIAKHHIDELVRGDASWSMTELVCAMTIMAFFHSLCTFVWGMGVQPEVDMRADWDVRAVHPETPSHTKLAPGTPAAFTYDLTTVQYEEDLLKGRLLADSDPLDAEVDASDDVFAQAGAGAALSVEATKLEDASVIQFCGHPMHYVDFDTAGGGIKKSLRSQDYCWDDHGFALVSKFFPTAAELLDNQFALTYNLTYNTFSDATNVNTEPIRQSVWYYVHTLFGIRNDDFDYHLVNQFLTRPLKTYVKQVVCYPESTTQEDFVQFSAALSLPEKCHINLLSMEARKQAGLLYALRAVMQHMKG